MNMIKRHAHIYLSVIFLQTLLFSCQPVELIKEVPEPIINNHGANNKKILVVSHNTLDSNYLEYTRTNHQDFTKIYEYDYWFRNGNVDGGKFTDSSASNKIFRNGLYWQKIAAVEQALELNDNGVKRYDWVAWIDADAFFTNKNKNFDNTIAAAKPDDYFIIARDYPTSDCVNAGVWLVKNNQDGKQLIQQIIKSFKYYKSNVWPEQQAMQDLIYQYVSESDFDNNTVKKFEKRICDEARIRQNIRVIPQREMNSFYDYSEVDTGWRAGDFIAHMAGSTDKLKLIKRLVSCMAAKGDDLSGCEHDGSWR